MTDEKQPMGKQPMGPNGMECSASLQRAPHAGRGEAEGGEPLPRRFSARPKPKAVARHLRGEPQLGQFVVGRTVVADQDAPVVACRKTKGAEPLRRLAYDGGAGRGSDADGQSGVDRIGGVGHGPAGCDAGKERAGSRMAEVGASGASSPCWSVRID
jgi:hypothetical protein